MLEKNAILPPNSTERFKIPVWLSKLVGRQEKRYLELDDEDKCQIALAMEKFKVEQLKKFIRHRNEGRVAENRIKITGNKSVLIERLLSDNFDPWIDGGFTEFETRNVDQVLHDSWFMSPIGRGDCQAKGSANEKMIPKRFEEFMEGRTLRLLQIEETGLVCSKNEGWFSSSVDGVSIFYNEMTQDLELILLEYKTRSTNSSMSNIKCIRDELGELIEIDFGDDSKMDDNIILFKKAVPEKPYRNQLLMHCSVCMCTTVAYIENTMSEIIYVVVVKFPHNWLLDYKEIFRPLANKHILPFHEHNLQSDLSDIRKRGKELKAYNWAVDEDTYVLTYALWRVLDERTRKDGSEPLPPTENLVPAVVNGWNGLKGGVDVISRQLSNCRSCHPRQKIQASLILRTFFTLLVNCHVLERATNIFKHATRKGKVFKDYYELKKALNTYYCFKDYIGATIETGIIPNPTVYGKGLFPQDSNELDVLELKEILKPIKAKRLRDTLMGTISAEKEQHVPMYISYQKKSNATCILCCKPCTGDWNPRCPKRYKGEKKWNIYIEKEMKQNTDAMIVQYC